MRLLIFSTLNTFAGLDDFPLECLVYYLQEKANTFLPRIRSLSRLTIKALTGNLFQAAVNAGNDHVVEVLLQDWATSIGANKQVFVDGDKRYTALQRPCQLHHVAVTRVLLRHGADANHMIQRYGLPDWSALELAIGRHKDERDKLPPAPPGLVLLLVENGANFGYELLRHVIMRRQLQVLEILLHKLIRETWLRSSRSWQCHRRNDFDLIKLLLEYNVDASGYIKDLKVYGFENVWKTPLAIAVESNEGTRLQVVGILLDAGVNPDSLVYWYPESRKETALLVAIKLKSVQMVKFLLDSGASENFAPNMGVKRTPLQQSVEVGDMAMIQTLINHGAQVTDAPAYIGGAAALQLAAIGGYIGIAGFLLQAGADLHAPGATVHGQTTLEGAAEHGRLDMVKFLINAGALNVGDRYRCLEKAARLALNHGHCAVVDLLGSFLLRITITTN
ncbi:uncharacterized protein A1O9_01613 [Exophiala aquamarina CBS 119918]|uniref:Uncharacterized protein n=1 Tax=Exophiala aquamarina CBS 119918 TaxID=1182545 RepID=A0A072Q6S2_9EURO|nr:uncharacterized protein A1O9_01613 [Exophiala aquamarina CBS 119918]KEF63635.1 hypothetical protein A1O9_01613 [Exophiala aquamarina CBS 119918]